MFVVFSWDVLQDKGKGVVTACDLKEALKAGGKLKGTSQTKSSSSSWNSPVSAFQLIRLLINSRETDVLKP